MLGWALGNSAAALVFALGVLLVGRALRHRPGVQHALWLSAMAVLLMPALPLVETPGGWARQRVRALVAPAEPSPSELARPVASAPSSAADALRAGRFEASAEPARERPQVAATAAPTVEAPRRAVDPLDVAAWVWALGAAAVLLVSARRILVFRRRIRRAPAAPTPPGLRAEVRAVARRLGVRAPRVRVLAGVASPSIWCFGEPLLLWPAGAESTSAERSTLIAHELAHLARRDHWIARLEVPAAALLWWNPLFWWIRGRIRHYAELTCDAWAVWTHPADRRAFAAALIDMQARTVSAPLALHGLGATDSELEDFERRLNMIMVKRVSPTVSKRAVAAALLTAVLVSPGFSGDGARAVAKAGAALPERVEAARGFQRGEELFAKKEYDLALESYLDALAHDPAHARAHARAGYLLVGRRELEPAKWHFERQLELGHACATALYNLGCVASLSGDVDAAHEFIAAAVRHGFDDPKLMQVDADLAAAREDERYAELVARVQTVLDLEAALERMESEGADALRFLDAHRELVELRSAVGPLALEHGHLALKAADYEQAAWAFGRQAELGHKPDYGYYNRACAYSLDGRVDEAIADLERAVKAGMSHAGVLEDADLDACRADPRFAALQARIAEPALETKKLKGLMKGGEREKARAILAGMAKDESCTLAQRVWIAQTEARLLVEAGRADEALAVLERATKLGESVDGTAFLMAEAHAARGDDAAALRYAEYALTLGFAEPAQVRSLLARNGACSAEQVDELASWAEKHAYAAKYGSEWKSKSKDKDKQKAKEKDADGSSSAASRDA